MNDTIYHDLYRYLNQEMTQEDSTAFEKLILEDENLAQEVTFHKDLLGGIELSGDQELQEKIKKVVSELEKGGSFRKKMGGRNSDEGRQTGSGLRIQTLFQPRYLAIAASATMILVLGFFLFRPSTPNYQQLYSQSFQLDNTLLQSQLEELDFTGMGNPKQTQNKSLLRGLEAIEAGDVARADSELTQHLDNYPDDEVAALFLAQIWMKNNEFEKAYTRLGPISQRESSYQAEALWYMALSTLQIPSKSDETQQLLEKIVAHPESKYAKDAKRILQEL